MSAAAPLFLRAVAAQSLRIPLGTTGTTLIGRGAAGIEDKRMSRSHASLAWAAGCSHEPRWLVESLGSNPLVLRRANPSAPLPDCTCALSTGNAGCQCHLRHDAVVVRKGAPPLEIRLQDRLFLLVGEHEFVVEGPAAMPCNIPEFGVSGVGAVAAEEEHRLATLNAQPCTPPPPLPPKATAQTPLY